MDEQVKATVYISKEDYKQLKARLALLDQNVSRWFFNAVKAFLKDTAVIPTLTGTGPNLAKAHQ